MSQYLFLYRRPLDLPPLSPAQMQQNMPKWQAWFKTLSESENLKDRGSALERDGKSVRGTKRSVTDGPYVEKDLVMGFTLVEARDLDHACELAGGCPGIDNGLSVEVRPVLQM